MTATRIPLDALTSDDLDRLYERADIYRDAWKSSRARWWKANARIDELDARVRELEAKVARLTAGQRTHTRVTHQHHTTPVDGCPWCTPGTDTTPPTHLAKGTNAEDCPACKGTNPDYPFLCPGPTTT